MSTPEAVDPKRLRDVLGQYPTGVVLITSLDPSGEPLGMVIGSFTSVSLQPPLVGWFPQKGSRTYELMGRSGRFLVNVLADEHEWISRLFSGRADDKWSKVAWSSTESGLPRIDDAIAWIECDVESVMEVGDHFIVLGRVCELEVGRQRPPLLFFQGGYGRFSLASVVVDSTPELVSIVATAENARPHLERLAQEAGAECGLWAASGGDLVLVATTHLSSGAGLRSVGTRVPLVAPFGDQYVCWLDDQARLAWVERAGIDDPDERGRLHERLSDVRRRAWSWDCLPLEVELRLVAALSSYSAGRLTPAQERDISREIAATSRYFDPPSLDTQEQLPVRSLVVPVLDGEQVVFNIELISPESPVSAGRISEWLDAMTAAATSVAEQVRRVRTRPRPRAAGAAHESTVGGPR